MIKETKHFISYYHEADRDLAERFVELLEEKYGEIYKYFKFEEGAHKYRFVLCGDVEEYIEKTGKKKEEYQSWMVGYSDGDTLTITLLSPRVVADRSYSEMEQIAVHELVHMIFDDVTKVHENDVEVWIAEGIAVLYAEQTDLDYISKSEYPKLVDLVGFDNFADNQGYDYAGIYVWYFIKKFGFDKFIEIYCNKCEWQSMIYDGFEAEAIEGYIKYVQGELN